MNSLYIVIPAYNEAKNIRNIIEEWYPVVERYNGENKSRLLIVDDGSRDDTLEIAESMKTDRPLLEVVSKSNGGHGAAIYFGYKYALARGADYIFQTDSDGQTLASEFEAFWNIREEYDAIIGNRVSRGDGIGRKMVSVFVRAVVAITFHICLEDVNTPYRIMKAKTLEEALSKIPEGYNLTNIAITAVMGKNERIKFLPITFRPRQAGKNSINLCKIIRLGSRALVDLFVINKRCKD